MAIAEVSVTAVRGIRQRVTLSLKGKSLALRGDNGTGKSSFVAALRWAVRGEKTVGQEDAKTAAEFWHHRLEAADAPSVTVTLRGGGTIEINSTGVRADEAGDRFRLACMRANPFLPRRQLLKFLEDKPGERFQYLESFLDLEQADEIHEVFAGLVSSSQEAMGVAARQRDLLVTRCLAHVPNDRHAGAKSWNALLAVLRQWATELSIVPGDTFEDLRDAVAGLRKLIDGDDLGRLRERLDRHRATLLALTSTPQPADPAVALERRRQLEAAASDAALADLLKLAADHFDSHPADEKCPVCTQSVDAMKVLSNLKVRGEALRELREVRSGLAALGREWVAFLTQVREAIIAFHLTVGGEPRFPPFLATAPAAEELLDRVDGTAAAILSEIELFIEGLLGRADDELAKLPDTASVPSLRALVAAIEAAGEAQLAMSIAESTVDAASRRHRETKAIAEALRRARQDVARTLLDDISKCVANYYRVIHPPSEPDEATGAPSIEVQRHKAGTAHVRGEFAQRRVEDPRLVYSDGHLDTVGICVFLALRRFRATRDTATDPKLIVLDDIVLSVDLGHARRLLDLLDAEFDDHQVLIFTHNGAFFEWCRTRLPAYQPLAIRGWSLEGGVEFGDYDTGFERLTGMLATTASSKLLAQAVMNVIDPWMTEARYVYALTLKSKRNDSYTLGDYWPAFNKAMKELEKELRAPIGDLQRLLGELKELTNVRNGIAAHDNDFAKEYPLTMVQGIARGVLALVDTLYCRKCQRFAEPTPREGSPVRVVCKCEALFYQRPRKVQPELP